MTLQVRLLYTGTAFTRFTFLWFLGSDADSARFGANKAGRDSEKVRDASFMQRKGERGVVLLTRKGEIIKWDQGSSTIAFGGGRGMWPEWSGTPLGM